MRYVHQALTGGEEHGYSRALLGVDGDRRGIEVRALDGEKAVIETDG